MSVADLEISGELLFAGDHKVVVPDAVVVATHAGQAPGVQRGHGDAGRPLTVKLNYHAYRSRYLDLASDLHYRKVIGDQRQF